MNYQRIHLQALSIGAPLMASKTARVRLGVKPRGFIEVRHPARDTVIIRQVRRLPASMLPEADDDVIFTSVEDLRLLGVYSDDDEVVARPTSDTLEVP